MKHVGHDETRVWYDAYELSRDRWVGFATIDPGIEGRQTSSVYLTKEKALDAAHELAVEYSLALS